MTTETVRKFILFPKESIADLIEAEHSEIPKPHLMQVVEDNNVLKNFSVEGPSPEYDGVTPGEISTYQITYTELVSNILYEYDPDLLATDITAVTNSVDQSKFRVEY